MIDKCVICNADSPYQQDEHIDFRIGYVEGCGQLCLDCYGNVETLGWHKIEKIIDDTPNDMELGGKIRAIRNDFKFNDNDEDWSSGC